MNLVREIKNQYTQTSGVYYLNEPNSEFEDIYIKLRRAEGRMYDDTKVKLLPSVSKDHKHYNEWLMRKKSSQMLFDYMDTNDKSILEVGCGNGWIANKLAESKGSEVIALDVNKTELEQAARVFGSRDNIAFVYGDIFTLNMKFDYIVLAGVTSYFKDISKLLSSLLANINPNGEIHIIDSPFYNDTEGAKQKSAKYYWDLGFDDMINHYHHHTIDKIKEFKNEILYNPATFVKKIKSVLGFAIPPFYWIKISA